jgi:hypothetical protein
MAAGECRARGSGGTATRFGRSGMRIRIFLEDV